MFYGLYSVQYLFTVTNVFMPYCNIEYTTDETLNHDNRWEVTWDNSLQLEVRVGFMRANVIEICNGMMFDFYPALPHI